MTLQTKTTNVSRFKVEYSFDNNVWFHLGGRWFNTYEEANNYLNEVLNYTRENTHVEIEFLRIVFKSETVEHTYYEKVTVK